MKIEIIKNKKSELCKIYHGVIFDSKNKNTKIVFLENNAVKIIAPGFGIILSQDEYQIIEGK